MIDPIVVRLLDVKGRYDISMQQHLFETLQAMLEFGGTALGKVCQETDVNRSTHPGLMSRTGKYSGMLVELATRYVLYRSC